MNWKQGCETRQANRLKIIIEGLTEVELELRMSVAKESDRMRDQLEERMQNFGVGTATSQGCAASWTREMRSIDGGTTTSRP